VKDEDKTRDQLVDELQEMRNRVDEFERSRNADLVEKDHVETTWERDELARLVLEATNDGIWDWNTKTGEAYFSPRYYTMLGYEPDEFPPCYNSWRGLLHPDDLEKTEAVILQALKERISYAVEFRMKGKNETWHWILSRGKAVALDNEGHVARMVGSHTDISERKRNEETLRDKDQLLQDIGSLVKVGAWKVDLETGIATTTGEVARISGFESVEDVDVESGLSCYHGVNREKIEKAFKEASEQGIPYDLELELVTAKGIHKWVRTTGHPFVKDGRVVLVQGSLQDISERKQIEESLRLARFAVDSANIGIYRISASGQIEEVNQKAAELLDYTKEELENLTIFDIDLDAERYFWNHHWQNLHAEQVQKVERKHRRKDGSEITVEINANNLQYEGQTYIIAFVQDISQRKQAEEELRKTKEFAEYEQAKWRTVLEHVSTGVAVFDASANLIYANGSHAKIYAFKEGEQTQLNSEFIDNNFVVQTYPGGEKLPCDQWPAPRVLRGEHLEDEIISVRRLDRDLRIIVRMSGIPVYNAQGEAELAVIVSNDITAQVEHEKQDKIMQERMAQTQRLESLGVLAGGIAHDFNNLLMAILGHADIALLKLLQPSPLAENLENIKVASLRAADLCTQLLAYSGHAKIEEEEFSISALVSEMARMLKTSISKTCVLDLNLDEQLPAIIGDSSQMRQIVMNFVINASEAIGDGNGIIKVSTGSVNYTLESFGDDYVIKPEQPGHYVTLEVSDNGPGMDKETLEHIFEPFYTTKFTGRGLGLSAVLGIIRSHGGGLRVHSEPGAGTSFRVLFPAIGRRIETPAVGDGKDVDNARFVGKVLLVDDEDLVRNVCSSQLKLFGLEVLTARDGLEGVEIYRENRADIDLVILDLSMPKMGGKETFRILRQLDPEVKVVLASGYAQDEMSIRFTKEKPSGYLRKPYTIKELSPVLSSLLPGNCCLK